MRNQQMTFPEISNRLRLLSNPAIAEQSQRFFKTGKGEYGEGDQFLGIRVPAIREQVRNIGAVKLEDVHKLLKSAFHEERLCALLLMVRQFAKGNIDQQTDIYHTYLANTQYINNWDLVDSSASQIVGRFLESRDRSSLYELVRSRSIWERRIAVISTFYFIRNHQFDDSLNLASLLLDDKEDLIQKAVGWMLREIGKRDTSVEATFLQAHYRNMPRTMLRYAIEKFPKEMQKLYLSGAI